MWMDCLRGKEFSSPFFLGGGTIFLWTDGMEAEELFERLTSLSNDVGLFSEDYDLVSGRMLGNFPKR